MLQGVSVCVERTGYGGMLQGVSVCAERTGYGGMLYDLQNKKVFIS